LILLTKFLDRALHYMRNVLEKSVIKEPKMEKLRSANEKDDLDSKSFMDLLRAEVVQAVRQMDYLRAIKPNAHKKLISMECRWIEEARKTHPQVLDKILVTLSGSTYASLKIRLREEKLAGWLAKNAE